MLEFKTYGEVDLDESPIVVLSCGHFFTAETLDGHVGMANVYNVDPNGCFVSLREMEFSHSIPRCPDCQRPIQQHATQRYNRLINHAVIDESSKRFLVSGKADLQAIEDRAISIELDFEGSRQKLKDFIDTADNPTKPAKSSEITNALDRRLVMSGQLAKAVASFLSRVSEKDQPIRKLYDATVKTLRAKKPIEDQMKLLTIGGIPISSRDRRIIFGGLATKLKVTYITLTDQIEIVRSFGHVLREVGYMKISGTDIMKSIVSFFKSCEEFIADCSAEILLRFNVEARLYYGRIASMYNSTLFISHGPHLNFAAYKARSKELLEEAQEMCSSNFQNAAGLKRAVEQTLRQLGKEWYEPISAGELAAIKAAMVSGESGLATNSGHWYNCKNGHPFAIGECGMPMEEACCPECGAPVGGQDHSPAAGVTRATHMEN
ncbi:MAG: hypothetical protein M1819_000632 [Sarea resinae]|nr:MAG: hypothetical protein M1819_000632 [Sarea resinae]